MASGRIRTLLELIGGLLRLVSTICKWILIDWGILRKPATIADLAFPVLILRPGKVVPIVDLGSTDGTPTKEFSQKPIEGAVVIDSNFRMYTQRHVRCRQGEISMIFDLLLVRKTPITYRVDLKRRWRSGNRPALRLLNRSASLEGSENDNDGKRSDLAGQTTLAGMIGVLGTVTG